MANNGGKRATANLRMLEFAARKLGALNDEVVTYAKCFVKGKGRNANFGSAKIFKEKVLHKKLMQERHKYHAHADQSESEYLQAVLATNPKNQTEKRLCCINYQKAHELVPKLKEYLILVDEAIKHVKIKASKAHKKCHDEETKN